MGLEEEAGPELAYSRIISWLNRSDYKDAVSYVENDLYDGLTDITSVTRNVVSDADYLKRITTTLESADCSPNDCSTDTIGCPHPVARSLEDSTPSLSSISKLTENLKSKDVIKVANTTPWLRLLNKLTVSDCPLNKEINLRKSKPKLDTIRSIPNETIACPVVPYVSKCKWCCNFPLWRKRWFGKYNRATLLCTFWETTLICIALLLLDLLVNPDVYYA